MQINDVVFNAELIDIVKELQAQLQLNNIHFLGKIKDTVNNVQICCPYHNGGQERRPSAGIRKSDGIFHCFACGETHNLQEVISHCFGRTDDVVGVFGWQWLLKNFKSVDVEDRRDIQLNLSRTIQKKESHYVTEEELDSYRYIHPYMYERKLTDEVIELFDLGYDDTTESITFPVKDINGNCLFIARRGVKSKWFNYPAGVEKPLYGLYEIVKYYDTFSYYSHSNALALDFDLDINSTRPVGLNLPLEVIVCESMLDALTCWVYGKCAVALNGLGNELAIKQLNDLPCRKVILATDKDEAGRQARVKLRKQIKNKIITEYDYSSYPAHAKDINDMSFGEFKNLIEIF